MSGKCMPPPPSHRPLRFALGAGLSLAGLGAGVLLTPSCSSTPLPNAFGGSAMLNTLPASAGNTTCNNVDRVGLPWISVNTPGTAEPTAVTSTGTGGITTACAVTPANGGYNVQATVTANGNVSTTSESPFYTVTIEGTFAVPVDGGAPVNNFVTQFVSSVNNYSDPGCVAILHQANGIGANPAAGRIWIDLTCSNLTDNSTNPPTVCAASAHLRFQNCSGSPP